MYVTPPIDPKSPEKDAPRRTNRKVVVLDAKTGRIVRSNSEEVKEDGQWRDDIAFADDSTDFTVAGKEVVLYDGGSLRPVKKRADLLGPVSFLRGKERRLLAITKNNDVVIWDIEKGKTSPLPIDTSAERVQGKVCAMALSADGKLIALATDRGVYWWDVATGKQRNEIMSQTDNISVGFSHGGGVLWAGGIDGVVGLYASRTGEHLHTVKCDSRMIPSAAWSDDDTRLAVCSAFAIGPGPGAFVGLIEVFKVTGLPGSR
jgi:WD40 repeat protein